MRKKRKNQKRKQYLLVPLHHEHRFHSLPLVSLCKSVCRSCHILLAVPAYVSLSRISLLHPPVEIRKNNVLFNLNFQFFFFVFVFFYFGFTALSRIFHLYRADHSSKVCEKWRTRRKNNLTICKQNLAFPYVTPARLEP